MVILQQERDTESHFGGRVKDLSKLSTGGSPLDVLFSKCIANIVVFDLLNSRLHATMASASGRVKALIVLV